LYYAGIKNCDVANGPGFRVTLFVSGCRNRCPGCFNPETWSFTYGQEFTLKTLLQLDNALDDEKITGLSILGGDPFEPENIEMVTAICEYVKVWYPGKSIWVWTGYDFIEDGLIDMEIMKYIDVLIDGKFEESLKDLTLKWRGSSNQRVIDVAKSVKHRCAIRWNG
jgi:anaerobic ribonucleoside-triphosphate reductase activating protein